MEKAIPPKEEKIKVKITLMLDGRWASHLTTAELAEYIEGRLNSSLGFRGQIKRFKLLRES